MESLQKNCQQEQIEKDCAICFMIMVEPTQYPCGHRFCLQCTQHLYENEHTQKCPLCRESLPNKLPCDKEYAKQLQEAYPDEYKKQLVSLQKSKMMVKCIDREAYLDDLWIQYRDFKGNNQEKNHKNVEIMRTLKLHYKDEIAQLGGYAQISKFIEKKMDKLKKKHGRRSLY